jgi:hypothetical protein
MLRNRKSRSGLRSFFILTFLSATGNWVATASDDVPTGYKADRYQKVWERNPFTLVTPVAPSPQAKLFDKYVLLSWLNDGGKDVVFVQNTETNEVQKVTKDPNSKNLRLVAIHKDADPKNEEVVLSNGAEQGSVKFRLETVAVGLQSPGGQQPSIPNAGAQNQIPGAPTAPLPGMPRQAQMSQNAQQTLQQGARFGANQQGTVQMQQPETVVMPPRASEVRRKRITPPPAIEQQVGVPTPGSNNSNQPQTQ